MKILFTSVGRRVELVQCFKRAAETISTDLKIYGADIDITAPALLFCDCTVLTPRIRTDEYIPFLLNYCKTEGINAIIPTIDTDLLVLAQNKERFTREGIRVIISDPDKISICRNKNITSDYFRSLGLHSPVTVNDVDAYNEVFPAFIKPKDGSSSVNAFKVNDSDELKLYASQIQDYVIQPFVSGTEYTVDVFCDFNGNPIYITPRIRLSVRSGEVLKTQICQEPSIIEEIKSLIADFKPCGPITVQIIRDEATEINWYIEINPRFGGGAPLSMMAGADSAVATLRLLQDETLDYCTNAAEDKAVYSRFDQSVRIS